MFKQEVLVFFLFKYTEIEKKIYACLMVSENYHNYHTQFTHHMKGIFILGKGM